jgi:hypothetical protein
MTNEEVMQLMTDMGLHEGGIENWVMDNAWVLVVNKAIEKEREACAEICDGFYLSWIDTQGRYEFMGEGASECAGAIRTRGNNEN